MTINPNECLTVPADDLAACSSRLSELKIIAQSRRLTPDESREGVQLTRILRRTNTGPAMKKASAKKKATLSDNELDALLDL